MNGTKHLFFALAGILTLQAGMAQEKLTGLIENPLARPQPKLPATRATAPPLELPFVDCFVPTKPWPNTELWTTNGVYVNDHYAVNMPTIGIATFDALDTNGRVYPWLTGTSMPADTLTSLPINLAGTHDVVLSFFFQAGGLADIPEANDLFYLEFYSPSDDRWEKVWHAYTNIVDTVVTEIKFAQQPDQQHTRINHKLKDIRSKFIYTALEVNPQWLQSGFQFRFVNMVSLTVNIDAPGRSNNADVWHLSFLYLDKSRNVNDTLLLDVGIAAPQGPLTKVYESVPASHLNTTEAQRNLFGATTDITFTYRNLGWGTRNVSRRFSIKPLYGSGMAPINHTLGSENISDGQLHIRTFHEAPYYFSADTDAAAFEICSYLVIEGDAELTPLRRALRSNDTTTYIQRFHDYYAYDDGSAENGYGLFGNGTGNGRVAVQFQSYRTDSLRGVYMYFNFAKDSANLKPFRLAVWDDNDGVPGNLIYSHNVSRPAIRDSMNKFVAYKFRHALPIARGQAFYVGWIQTSEVFLNIGFDANRLNGHRNFYALNAFGGWSQSIYDGSLMIRPIFCDPQDFPDDFVPPPPPPTPVRPDDDYLLYPNPAYDQVSIRNLKAEREMSAPSGTQRIEVYNLRGTLVHSAYTPDGTFSVAKLPAGVYIVRIYENNMVKSSRKIIIAR